MFLFRVFYCLLCDVTFRCFFSVFFSVYCVTSLSCVSFSCFLSYDVTSLRTLGKFLSFFNFFTLYQAQNTAKHIESEFLLCKVLCNIVFFATYDRYYSNPRYLSLLFLTISRMNMK